MARWSMALACVGGLAALAGCGGGGGGGSIGSGFATRNQFRNDQLDRVLSRPDTRVSDLPVAGAATYAGYAGFVVNQDGPAEDAYLGDLSLRANFGTARVNGQIDNFSARSGASVTGSLAIGGAPIIGTTFQPRFGGALRVNGSPASVDGDVDGAFFGRFYEGVAGTLTGSIARDGLLLPIDSGSFSGER